MEGPITNGTPHGNEDNDTSNSDSNMKLKIETRAIVKQTSTFSEMRSGFLEEVNKFLLSGNIDRLKQKWNSYSAKEVMKRVSMEQALKDKVVPMLSCPNNDTHVEDLKKFLKSVLVLCTNEHITILTLVNILSDIVDTSTLSVCEGLFYFVEENLSEWKKSAYFAPGKNNILRMCNDLLRRLSKAQNTVFCGRILLFLAMFFPFSERSGLNIVSEFNSDVIYKNENEDGGIEEAVEIVDVSLKLEEDFHSKFWLIQEYFHNPNICFNKTKWKEFTEITNLILGTFKKHRLNRDAGDRLTNQYKSEFFTKFLTSQKLLVLQLSDSNFRRTICIQMLLLFQFLTGQIKTKQENQELSESETEWVKETTDKIYSVIKETPPDGDQFLIITKNMVQREDDWNSWKNEGCPALKKVMTEVKRQSTIEDCLGQKSFSVLSAEAATGFDTIFVPSKTGPPQTMSLKHSFDDYISSLTPAPELKDFLAEAIEEAERKMEPEKKKVADPSFAWLSVKLISLKAPTFFSNSHSAVPSMSEYVDIMCKKLYRDLNPGLLLPPYMPAPKSAVTKTKKPLTKSTNGSGTTSLKQSMKKPKVDNVDKTVLKAVKGGAGKVVKTVQGIKVIKDGENDSSQTSTTSEKSKIEEKKEDLKSSEKIKTNNSVKSISASDKLVTAKKIEKPSESSFAKPSAPGKSEKHKPEKVSRSPSPKPQRKVDDKGRKEERRGDKKVEKRSRERSVENSRKLEKGKTSAKSSPGKRKASPRRDEHKSSKVVREREHVHYLPKMSEARHPASLTQEHFWHKNGTSPSLTEVEETKTKDVITRDQIHDLAKSIASNWKKLADRLGYKTDEILYFESEGSSDYHRAMNLLLVWVSDEEDATKEILRRHLKNLGLTSAVSIISK